jgi:hypothetical protein
MQEGEPSQWPFALYFAHERRRDGACFKTECDLVSSGANALYERCLYCRSSAS